MVKRVGGRRAQLPTVFHFDAVGVVARHFELWTSRGRLLLCPGDRWVHDGDGEVLLRCVKGPE